MNLKGCFIIGFLLCTLASCVSYRYIDIQVLYPGKVTIPSNIKTLHIIEPQMKHVDNSIVIVDTSLKKEVYFKFFIHAFDSSLTYSLQNSPAFRDIDVIVQKDSQLKNELKNISPGEKESHGILSIQKITLTDTIKTDTSIPDNEFGYAYYSFYSMCYLIKIEFANPEGTKFYNTCTSSDTLTWRGKGNYANEASLQIPPTFEAVAQTGKIAAEKYSKWLAPSWVPEERMLFYNGNKYMRKGHKFFARNELPEAISAWKHLYDVGTPLLASIAAHNVALVYEMTDDLSNCEIWLKNSLQVKWHNQTKDYLYRIQQRIEFQKNLDKQLKR